jgi:hypothetical protein
MSGDRTVHGRTRTGSEIVRYDRAGRWWLEAPGKRLPLNVHFAADLAAKHEFFPGLPGGRRFDALVRARRGELAAKP